MLSQTQLPSVSEVETLSQRPTLSAAEQQAFVERLKALYKADHQAELLFLQAEVDSLLLQLRQAQFKQV